VTEQNELHLVRNPALPVTLPVTLPVYIPNSGITETVEELSALCQEKKEWLRGTKTYPHKSISKLQSAVLFNLGPSVVTVVGVTVVTDDVIAKVDDVTVGTDDVTVIPTTK